MQGSISECTSKQLIVLRADCSPKIGYGHMFRIIAIAELLGDHYCYHVVTQSLPDFLKAELNRASLSYTIVDGSSKAPDERKHGEELTFDMAHILKGDEIVVTDGYCFGPNYQSEIKKRGCKLVCIDDLAEFYFVGDVVINHAPGIDPNVYKRSPNTRVCLGIKYLIIKKKFFDFNKVYRNSGEHRLIVSLGGSDIHGITASIVKQVVMLDSSIHIDVVYTKSFSAAVVDELFNLQRANPERIELKCELSSDQIVQLFDASSHAILSASTIALECISRKLRPMIGYYTANQNFLYEGLTADGLAIGVGDFRSKVLNTTQIDRYLRTRNFADIAVKSEIPNVFRELADQAG